MWEWSRKKIFYYWKTHSIVIKELDSGEDVRSRSEGWTNLIYTQIKCCFKNMLGETQIDLL